MMFRFCLEREEHLLTVETSLVVSSWTCFLHVKQFRKMSISNKDRDVTSMDQDKNKTTSKQTKKKQDYSLIMSEHRKN